MCTCDKPEWEQLEFPFMKNDLFNALCVLDRFIRIFKLDLALSTMIKEKDLEDEKEKL